MAGPINGLSAGVQQQALQQSQQQLGQNANQVRPQDERQQPEANRVQPQSAAPAEAQNASTDNGSRPPALEQNNQTDLLEQAEQRRGSLVDISV